MSGTPTGWTEVELGEVWHESRARARPDAIAQTDYIGLEHVEGGTNRITGAGRSDGVKSAVAVFSAGDVLYGRLRPYLNKVIQPSFAGVASTEFLVFKEAQALVNGLLMHLLSSSDLVAYASANSAGVNLPRISAKRLAEYRLLLAPLPEQHRIVAKIESLFARLDEGVAALKRAQANLERYRASVLKAAVEGRLTEHWRSENPPEETGEELLGRILAERRKRWVAEQLAKFVAKGRKPPRNWKAKYKEPLAPDTSGLPVLPDGWCWATVEQFASTASGGTPDRREDGYFGGGIPWVKSGELKDGTVLASAETISGQGLASSSAKVFPAGTLCIALYGATVGKLGLLRMDAATNQAVCGILSPISALPNYLYFFLRALRPRLIRSGKGGAQPNISQQIVRQTPVALPPLPEQEAIIAALDAQLSVVQQASDRLLRNCLDAAVHLRQSVLKRAFEGGLVPQDPADEPASVLLERIRAEREAKRKRSKRRAPKPRRQPKSRVS